VLELAQQETDTVTSQASAAKGRQYPSPTAAIEQPEEALTGDKAATKAGIVDIASILGVLTVTVVGRRGDQHFGRWRGPLDGKA
jgi:hypothetical protein